MFTNKELVENIREIAKKNGTSLTKIEKKLGWGNGKIGKWESAKKYHSSGYMGCVTPTPPLCCQSVSPQSWQWLAAAGPITPQCKISTSIFSLPTKKKLAKKSINISMHLRRTNRAGFSCAMACAIYSRNIAHEVEIMEHAYEK